MPRFLAAFLVIALAPACRERVDQSADDEPGPPTSVKGPPLANEPLRPAPSAAAVVPKAADDTALRRAYGPKEMKLHPCAKLQPDGVVIGQQCPSAFVVFGPYVEAPASARLSIGFEFESDVPVEVMSDVVSEVGKRFHGSIDQQNLPPSERRHLGYSIQLTERVVALEARVGIRATGTVNFKLSKLTVVVQ
jgi:hypothetical protein